MTAPSRAAEFRLSPANPRHMMPRLTRDAAAAAWTDGPPHFEKAGAKPMPVELQPAIRSALLLLLVASGLLPPAARGAEKVDLSKRVKEPDAWFASEEGRRVLDNVVSWQNAN